MITFFCGKKYVIFMGKILAFFVWQFLCACINIFCMGKMYGNFVWVHT